MQEELRLLLEAAHSDPKAPPGIRAKAAKDLGTAYAKGVMAKVDGSLARTWWQRAADMDGTGIWGL